MSAVYTVNVFQIGTGSPIDQVIYVVQPGFRLVVKTIIWRTAGPSGLLQLTTVDPQGVVIGAPFFKDTPQLQSAVEETRFVLDEGWSLRAFSNWGNTNLFVSGFRLTLP